MGCSGESSNTSTSNVSISSARIREKRGSCSAASAAHLVRVSPRAALPSTIPMQPRSFLATCRVTNSPRRSAKIPVVGKEESDRSWQTAWRTPWRASSRIAIRSSSERDGILLLLLRFQHVQLAALLDAESQKKQQDAVPL